MTRRASAASRRSGPAAPCRRPHDPYRTPRPPPRCRRDRSRRRSPTKRTPVRSWRAPGLPRSRRRDRGREAQRGGHRPRRDRRRRARRHVRLGPRGLRRGARRPSGCSTTPAATPTTIPRAQVAPALADRLTYIGKERVFVMHWRGDDAESSVFLSQRDVRELQFAKASIATGWEILLGELGVDACGDLRRCCSPARFGQFLSASSAIRIGLVPRMALPRIVSAGNVAGEGAKIAALSHRERAEARRDRARGPLRRALRPRGLQRPVHRPAAGSRDERRRRDRLRGPRGPTCGGAARKHGWEGRRPSAPALFAQPAGADRRRRARRDRPAFEPRYDRVVVAYADCGTYGGLRTGDRGDLRGDHCYDVLGPRGRRARRWPGSRAPTCSPTSSRARSSTRCSGSWAWTATPELRDAYFGHYTPCSGSRHAPNARPRARRPSARRPRSGSRSRCARTGGLRARAPAAAELLEA